MTREELIELCKDAVVHHTRWNNRDSYCCLKGVSDIYQGLTAGLTFSVKTDEDRMMHNVYFDPPIDIDRLITKGGVLGISSVEDYYRDCDPKRETEMFEEGAGIDWHSEFLYTFLPTRKCLEQADGGEWWYI